MTVTVEEALAAVLRRPREGAARIGDATAEAIVPETMAKDLLRAFGLSVPRGKVATSPRALAEAAAALDPPLVVKIVTDEITHKSRIGGVRLHVRSVKGVEVAAQEILESATAEHVGCLGFLVEEHAPAGSEIFIGVTDVPAVGKLMVVGPGGVDVESGQNFWSCLLPLPKWVTSGPRVEAVLPMSITEEARAALAELVSTLEGIVTQLGPRLQTLECNPVIVTHTGVHIVDASILLATGSVAAPCAQEEEPKGAFGSFRQVLRPQSVVVVGASATKQGLGNKYLRHLRENGFQGEVRVMHPRADSIDGYPCIDDIRQAGGRTDYAIVAVPGEKAAPLVNALAGRARMIHVLASPPSEEDSRKALEAAFQQARRQGSRVLGPNCLGLHSPQGRLSFISVPELLSGSVAFVSQSGGLAADFVRECTTRGVGLRVVASVGDSWDVGVADAVKYLCEDDETRVIGLYVEDLNQGRRLAQILRQRSSPKEVVLLAGGTSSAGGRAARSHTGAIVGNRTTWQAIANAVGGVMVEDLDALIAVVNWLDCYPVEQSQRPNAVFLMGTGGGASVLGSDAISGHSLQLSSLEIDAPSAGIDCRPNPLDLSTAVLAQDEGPGLVRQIMDTWHDSVTDVLLYLNVANFLEVSAGTAERTLCQIIDKAIDQSPGSELVRLNLVLRGGNCGDKSRSTHRAVLDFAEAARVPVFESISMAARVLGHVRHLSGWAADTAQDGRLERR